MSLDTNFYYSFLVLPPAKRRAIVAVWRFCRAVDDAVDNLCPAGAADPAATNLAAADPAAVAPAAATDPTVTTDPAAVGNPAAVANSAAVADPAAVASSTAVANPAAVGNSAAVATDPAAAVTAATNSAAIADPAAAAAAAGARAIARWRAELDRCCGPGRPETAQGRALKPFIDRFGLSREPFEDLLDGVAMDVAPRRYERFDDLHAYCRRVASAVGLICIDIFGYRHPGSREYAQALGVALQLTNIIRDVPGDLARGRVYLPQEDLRRFGVTERDLAAGWTPGTAALMAFQCRRARSFYARSKAALPAEDARRLVAAEIMSGIYMAILRRIENRRYDVFSGVVRVPRPHRAVIAASIWTQVMLRRGAVALDERAAPQPW